jgi:signal transduction histidine kinase/CheY-like chemotaxis protein
MPFQGLPRSIIPPANQWTTAIRACLLSAWILLWSGGGAFAAPAAAPPAETITDPAQLWALPTEEKAAVHPLRIEGRVSYYDPRWGLFWLERNGVGTYLQLSSSPPAMRTGQYVVIEGSIIPAKGLAADRVSVKVLRDYEPIAPLDANGKIREMGALGGRVVTADGYVDGQQLIDDDHVLLSLIVDSRPVTGWMKPDDPHAVPNWQGCFVRVVGVYSGRFDLTGTQTSIELFVGRQRDLTVLGSIAAQPDFDLPRTPIDGLYQTPPGHKVHIRGRVQFHQPGVSMIVRDETGQVVIHSVQQQRLPFGAEVDVVGQVAISGAQWILQPALYREARPPSQTEHAPPPGSAVLESVDQVRQLTAAEAARGRPVAISGMVTWALPGFDFFFLQDLTGGIRVRYAPAKMETPRLQQYFAIEGVTYNDGPQPAVALEHYRNLGSMTAPPARQITFDQAITGGENGQWVEMRGFLQSIESTGDQRRIHVTTPAGEFVAHLQSPVNFTANPGSLIRVCGVCETTADRNGRITGVMLRVPFLHNFTIEEDAPVDIFDLPSRSILDLRQLSATRDMMRVRVSGTVLAASPDQSVHIADTDAGLLVLGRETPPLAPGDEVEAVGILGREGLRPVLREAVFRKRGSGPPPAPLALGDPELLSMALDQRLVRVQGNLIDTLRRPGQTRLTLQRGSTLFEAILDHAADTPLPAGLTPGAGLALTGICRIIFDDARQLRGFQLQLRSPRDIAVIQPARFWTAERALLAAALLGACTLLGLGWITALRRRVTRQTAQIRAQMERQAGLEAEVERATRLESLGVLAGGIAHDFNNLLTVVMGNVSLAMLDEKAAGAAGGFLREIDRAAHRARDLTQQLLTFAKGGEPLRAPVALASIVREVADSVVTGPAVRCEHAAVPGLWEAAADKGQVAQAIRNLLLNAVEAMPRGGVIRISLDNEEIAAGATPPLAAGRYVRLVIADSGDGIKSDVLPRIFDPYFSTKRTGGGLGLATTYSIVKRHQGHIAAASIPGQGATFALWLPAAESPPSAEPSPTIPAAAPLPPKSARVLLMDDEESIRTLGSRLLELLGLEVTVVADGAAAVREFSAARHSGRPFDLLILDLTIPGGMGGKETIAALRRIDVQVPAIVSSGYSNDPVMADFRRYGFQAMMPKPYEIRTLTDTVGHLLARRP